MANKPPTLTVIRRSARNPRFASLHAALVGAVPHIAASIREGQRLEIAQQQRLGLTRKLNMPKLPTPLSELPDFLPLGEPGSDEELACALGTFTNHAANLDFVRHLARLATQHTQKAQQAGSEPVDEDE